jgi:hypothetical protein
MVIQKATGTDEAQEHGRRTRTKEEENEEKEPTGDLQGNIIYSYEIHNP